MSPRSILSGHPSPALNGNGFPLRWYQRRKRNDVTIDVDERSSYIPPTPLRILRYDPIALTLAIECGPALGGYRLTRAATLERRLVEFSDGEFAAAQGRLVVPLVLDMPGYYSLSADIICPRGRASSLVKVSSGEFELFRAFEDRHLDVNTIGITATVSFVVR